MAKLLGWLALKAEEHLSDQQLITAIDADSPQPLPAHSVRHLERCWQCLARKRQLKETIFKIVDYQRELLVPFLPPPDRGEERFLARLDSQIQTAGHRFWPRFLMPARSFGILPMNPVLASVVVVLLAFSSLLLIWRRSTPTVSVNEVFESGEKWDKNPSNGEAGVVYQRIRIRTPQQTFERTVYRDAQRRRRPRSESPKPQEEQLATQLKEAGVNWAEPLSIDSFKQWHDQQMEKKDQVRAGADMLTLTTEVENGAVANQSLTLRKSDFHPLSRRIQFRTSGTVEIAELDYAVLGWSAVNDSIFEPVEPLSGPSLQHLAIASLPTREELDEAELLARVILSQLNADGREQLEFSRSSRSIVINGVVETNERKNALLAQLRTLPHVVTSIFSLEDLNSRRDLGPSSTTAVQAYSAEAAGPSPLEALLRGPVAPEAQVSSISREILDAALALQQDSTALTELLQRFSRDSRLSYPARKALEELTERHYKNLMDELDEEEHVMRRVAAASGQSSAPGLAAKLDEPQTLTAAVARNRVLCTELISSAQSRSRTGQIISSEILANIMEIRRIANNSRTAAASAGTSAAAAKP